METFIQKQMRNKDYWANHGERLSSAEYRSLINPYVVAYTEKKVDATETNGAPTNFLNSTILPLPTAEGDKEKRSFRETIGDRVYEMENPTFTADVCGALAKHNCKHCYSSGLQHFSVPERAKWSEACWCVKNNLDRMEKQVEGTKQAILGY